MDCKNEVLIDPKSDTHREKAPGQSPRGAVEQIIQNRLRDSKSLISHANRPLVPR